MKLLDLFRRKLPATKLSAGIVRLLKPRHDEEIRRIANDTSGERRRARATQERHRLV